MRSNIKTKSRERLAIISPQNAKPSKKNSDALDQEGGDAYGPADMLLKFEVNEKGVGRILLPPSLSALLQSDRISISPFAGGLFIRSV